MSYSCRVWFTIPIFLLRILRYQIITSGRPNSTGANKKAPIQSRLLRTVLSLLLSYYFDMDVMLNFFVKVKRNLIRAEFFRTFFQNNFLTVDVETFAF